MVTFSSLVSTGLIVAASVTAAPMHQKRIAQVIADSTTQWVAACAAAGGAGQCSAISQKAFLTLLAAGKNCDQQDQADDMVDLAKTLKDPAEMIRLAKLFVQQPRNAPDKFQVPYCQRAPRNAELSGFFHCQFQGTVANTFSGDQTGNLPLGVQAVNPPGSCPASQTPVADGAQLTDTVKDPGTPQGVSGVAANGTGTAAPGSATTTSGASNSTATATAVGANSTNTAVGPAATGNATATAVYGAATPPVANPATPPVANPANSTNAVAGTSPNATSTLPPVNPTTSPAAAGASPAVLLANGRAAQALNAQFVNAKPGDPCTTEGSDACVGGAFAQCVKGALQPTSTCVGNDKCAAVPLLDKPGTVVTCDSNGSAEANIARSGATGGLTGSG